MRFNGGISFACKFAGVLAVGLSLAACSNTPHMQPKEYGLGGADAAMPGSPQDFATNVGDLVHFDEDQSNLTAEAQGILRNQARWLNAYPDYSITVEGHADERGTREYNIALGARRATAVKEFLAQQGVNPARMRTISYGKERPIAVCDDVSCWQQNRRAHTLLNNRAMARN